MNDRTSFFTNRIETAISEMCFGFIGFLPMMAIECILHRCGKTKVEVLCRCCQGKMGQGQSGR
jgi:hypothetical protein